MTLRHKCNVSGCYLDKLPDWACFDDCWAEEPRVKLRDVDGRLYQNGRHLNLEKKPIDYEPRGPDIRSAKCDAAQGNTHIIFGSELPDCSDVRWLQAWNLDGYPEGIKTPANLLEMWNALRHWWLKTYNGRAD